MSGGVDAGTVTGGWNFVVAAYVVTFSVLFIYGVSIITRFREERSRAAEEAKTS
jgi:hypothetical protein